MADPRDRESAMTPLRPMSPAAFAAYRESEIASFAEENVSCGRWPAEGALERSRAEFVELLPQGLDTPDNHLMEILASDDGPVVGHLWFAVEERNGRQAAFVYDIVVLDAHRRQGHARRALQALEGLAGALGFERISLHVAGDNVQAQQLYKLAGFAVTGVSMSKAAG